MYSRGLHPVLEEPLGRRFKLPEDVAYARSNVLRQAWQIEDPDARALAESRAKTTGGQPSVAAWDCTFSPDKSVSLLWTSGDRSIQEQVWGAHTTAVDAGLAWPTSRSMAPMSGPGATASASLIQMAWSWPA